MVYYKNGKWNISDSKVRIRQDGINKEKYVGVEGKEWWINFARKWSDTEIIDFIDVTPSKEQLSRIDNVNDQNISDGFSCIIGDYVRNGNFPTDINNKLRNLQLEEVNQQQGVDISQREIGEIMLGMQVSDIEIELLKLKGGI